VCGKPKRGQTRDLHRKQIQRDSWEQVSFSLGSRARRSAALSFSTKIELKRIANMRTGELFALRQISYIFESHVLSGGGGETKACWKQKQCLFI